jgi:hypothetical protein
MRQSRFAFLLILLFASAAHAQSTTASVLAFGGIDKLLDRIDGINIFYGRNTTSSSSHPDVTPWGHDYGVEFSFHVANFFDRNPKGNESFKQRIEDALHVGKARKPVTAADSAALAAQYDTTSMTIKKRSNVAAMAGTLTRVDTVLVLTPKAAKPDTYVDFDLGISYGQLDGVRQILPYEVRGYVRELPALSLYATVRPFGGWWSFLGFYGGVRVASISLQDTQLFVPTSDSVPIVSLSASTFATGLTGGLEFALPNNVRLVVERSSMRREFNSLAYNPSKSIPRDVPHSLSLSGSNIDFGVSFPIPKVSK